MIDKSDRSKSLYNRIYIYSLKILLAFIAIIHFKTPPIFSGKRSINDNPLMSKPDNYTVE